MTNEQRRHIHEAMVRLAEGHRDAFTAVFDGLWPPVLSFVRRAVPGHPDAEDVAQRTLLKVFARISKFDTTRDGVAWVFGIATFEVKTLRRQGQRRRETTPDEVLDRHDLARNPEAVAIDNDLRDALAEVLGALTAAERAALIDDGPGPSSGLSPAAWRKRRQRALERLRTVWRRRHA